MIRQDWIHGRLGIKVGKLLNFTLHDVQIAGNFKVNQFGMGINYLHYLPLALGFFILVISGVLN